jgi:hypothetical protein
MGVALHCSSDYERNRAVLLQLLPLVDLNKHVIQPVDQSSSIPQRQEPTNHVHRRRVFGALRTTTRRRRGGLEALQNSHHQKSTA